ncbi:MAG: hypothetical protein NC251_10450 [Lachnoclostridium sp.]|nr:hypothetical protein [Lachnospira sp.]MCM1248838.1 hypothetical protein [Lachnoclostridium sp.]MCM1535309.1 hypothetical protein [Clostridium sp.]
MPIPIIIGAGSAIAAALGIGGAAHGAMKGKKANDIMKTIKERNQKNAEIFEEKSELANKAMDSLGKLELNILNSFEEFSAVIEKIQNRPQFESYKIENVELPAYNAESFKEVSVGAGVLLGGLGGAAVGAAGGFAAAGAVSAAVLVCGTASTGTAIASLSGAAATNAALAALGGGAVATGGGGMAVGSLVLGSVSAGAGILIGGIIFNLVGQKLSDKAEEAQKQMEETEKTLKKIIGHLRNLEQTAIRYEDKLRKVNNIYQKYFSDVSNVVNKLQKTEWNEFDEHEKAAVQNSVLLAGLLYKMCQVNLVNKAESDMEINRMNQAGISQVLVAADTVVEKIKI